MRDAKGEVLVSLFLANSNTSSTAIVESVALWRALMLCAKLNTGEAVFEGDALKIIKSVCSAEEDYEWKGQLVDNIKGVFANKPLWIVQHTYTEGNKVANFLIKFAYTINGEKVWIEDGPEGYYSYTL